MAGEVVEVVAEEVGAVIVGDGLEDEAEVEELAGEGEFLGGSEEDGPGRDARVQVAFAEDAADAGVGVLEVGGGVAVEGEEFVPTEDVVALAVGEEIGVFEGAEADDTGNLGGQVREDPGSWRKRLGRRVPGLRRGGR